MSSLKDQEEQGLYQEEVQKLVDGVVEDIRNGHLTTRKAAVAQLKKCCNASWCLGDTEHVLNVLKWATYPTRYLYYSSQLGLNDDFNEGRAPFPWKRCAEYALRADCGIDLLARPEYRALPGKDTSGPAKKTGPKQAPKTGGQQEPGGETQEG